MATMTSPSPRSRTAQRLSALMLALMASAPLAAQDLRDIPQKTTTSVTGPAPQTKAQPKQGRQVQGPPAPLETQLRDTPPDEPVFRAPVTPAPQQVPANPPVTRTTSSTTSGATPRSATPSVERPAPSRTSATSPSQPRNIMPSAAAPAAGNAVTGEEGAGLQAPRDNPVTSDVPATDLTTFPTSATPANATDGGAVTGSGLNEAVTPPDAGSGSTLPWAFGGAALLGLGGLAYIFTRRRRGASAPVAAGYGGIELGQTPFADELTPSAAAAPITNALKAPKPKAPAQVAPVMRAPASAPPASNPITPVMATPSAPSLPEPVKPTADGRIVSRIKAPRGDAHIPAAPQAAPAQRATQPPEPVKSASDGRIVSRLKMSDIVDEPTPPPPPQRRGPPPPSVKTVSVGYSVNKRD